MKWRHGSDNNPLGHGRGRGVVVGVNCVCGSGDVRAEGSICFLFLIMRFCSCFLCIDNCVLLLLI